jgi:hypothetical protein
MTGTVHHFPGAHAPEPAEDEEKAARRRENAAKLRDWADRLERGDLQNVVGIAMVPDGFEALMSGGYLTAIALADILKTGCRQRVIGPS